jgi:hypothetical protein
MAAALKRHEAEHVASTLNGDKDDDWRYEAVHDPNGDGWSYIDCYDEDDKYVGRL